MEDRRRALCRRWWRAGASELEDEGDRGY